MRVTAPKASSVHLAANYTSDLRRYKPDPFVHGDSSESLSRLKGTPLSALSLTPNAFTFLRVQQAPATRHGSRNDFLAVAVSNSAPVILQSNGFSWVLLVFCPTDSTFILLVATRLQASTRLLGDDKASDNENYISLAYTMVWPHLSLDLQALLSRILASGRSARLYRHARQAPRRSLHLLFGDHKYDSGDQLLSLFNFLRYTGPRRLRKARRVLRDDETYHITHIGRGAFASISRVLYKPTGEVRVMKRITFDETGLAEYLAKNEVYGLKMMKGSTWFPTLLHDSVEDGEYVVTMPYYHRGDLAAFIEHKRLLGRDVAQFYCAQLLLAIQSLHKHGIVHRDIKTDNIFLDEAGHLILADLGLAENIAVIQGGEDTIKERYAAWMEARSIGGDAFPFLWADENNPLSMTGIAGTFWYTAPEVFRKERYSFGVDYWSLGVIYHELITGHIPFEFGASYPEDKRPLLDFSRKPGQLKVIAPWEEEEIRQASEPALPSEHATDAAQLLSSCTTERPQTVGDIKNLKIFRGVDWEAMSKKQVTPPRLPLALKEDSHHTWPF